MSNDSILMIRYKCARAEAVATKSCLAFARVAGRLSVLAILACALLFTKGASARAGGITSTQFPSLTTGCNGCHTSVVNTPAVTISAASTCLYTGESTVISVTISNANGGGGGWNLRRVGTGTLSIGGDDSAMTQVLSGEVTHNGRKVAAADGLIHFSAVYTAPGTATTATLIVWGNAVNGNGNNTGDHAATSMSNITVATHAACGTAMCGSVTDACGGTVDCGSCTPPSTCQNGSCSCVPNPNACQGLECGTVSDGCSGVVTCGTCAVPLSCGFPSANLCGCAPGTPNATCGAGECRRMGSSCLDSTCSAGSPVDEICDGLDNDCDGTADDGLPLATCGIGACFRTGTTCNPSSCSSGSPTGEGCDGIDNDCDGVVDNGDLCPGGLCIAGVCIATPPPGTDAGPDAGEDSGEPDAGAPTVPDAETDVVSTPDVAPPPEPDAGPPVTVEAGTDDALAPPIEGGRPDAVPGADAQEEIATDPDAGLAEDSGADGASVTEEDSSTSVPPMDDASPLDLDASAEVAVPTPTADARADAGDASIRADSGVPPTTEGSHPTSIGNTGTAPSMDDGGCSCRLGTSGQAPPGLWLAALGGIALAFRRRKGAA